MTDFKQIIKEADNFALSEIEKYHFPSLMHFNTANSKGGELAKKLKAEEGIVQLGTRLMDIKLGECISEGRLKEHIERSAKISREFLSKFDLPKDTVEKIINCVEEHHGTKKWACKEAEICANADCYRFLLLKDWLAFLIHIKGDFKLAEEKADEKWKVLSLDICKKELESDYKLIKEIIRRAK